MSHAGASGTAINRRNASRKGPGSTAVAIPLGPEQPEIHGQKQQLQEQQAGVAAGEVGERDHVVDTRRQQHHGRADQNDGLVREESSEPVDDGDDEEGQHERAVYEPAVGDRGAKPDEGRGQQHRQHGRDESLEDRRCRRSSQPRSRAIATA
ncbi:hypothetical protein A6E15_02945 [Natrinema saccharevitans]|uniref:Uncharacterized protein n=1 Tax=Natrinema saccharevitans TaxID=301967 RepID=A0A1S8ATZ7_9EURY|nr:hypothetical protein [Natrinema saccharevitans]OLZ39999.1 hypothetical protein A6E15_02945 [Natrinema saccharevitans]